MDEDALVEKWSSFLDRVDTSGRRVRHLVGPVLFLVSLGVWVGFWQLLRAGLGGMRQSGGIVAHLPASSNVLWFFLAFCSVMCVVRAVVYLSLLGNRGHTVIRIGSQVGVSRPLLRLGTKAVSLELYWFLSFPSCSWTAHLNTQRDHDYTRLLIAKGLVTTLRSAGVAYVAYTAGTAVFTDKVALVSMIAMLGIIMSISRTGIACFKGSTVETVTGMLAVLAFMILLGVNPSVTAACVDLGIWTSMVYLGPQVQAIWGSWSPEWANSVPDGTPWSWARLQVVDSQLSVAEVHKNPRPTFLERILFPERYDD